MRSSHARVVDLLRSTPDGSVEIYARFVADPGGDVHTRVGASTSEGALRELVGPLPGLDCQPADPEAFLMGLRQHFHGIRLWATEIQEMPVDQTALPD